MGKPIFLRNRELESLTTDERQKYFCEFKKYCINQPMQKNRLHFLQKIISALSSKIRNYELEIRGKENIPEKGNALFVANHSNAHDFLTMQETFDSIGIRTCFWASNENISQLVISVFRVCNGVLIDRNDKHSIDSGIFRFASIMATVCLV